MFSSHSFILCLLVLLPISVPPSRAQSAPDYSIRNIDVGSNVDIYPEYGTDNQISFCWDIYTGNQPLPNWDIFVDSSVELMNGTAEAASNEVIDIVGPCLIPFYPICQLIE